MKTTRHLALALALLLPLAASAALNEGVMTYSGYLRTSSGTPEPATQNITFKLWDAATAGNMLWTQSVMVTPDSQGWFSAVLGASPNAFLNTDLLNQTWLGIQVGAEAEMVPRTKVGAATHALSMEYAGLSGCTTTNQILQWTGSAWACIATPSGTGTGLTAVAHDGSLAGAGTAGSPLSLPLCADGQILQRSAGAWGCIATPAGTGGVTGVTATAPVVSSGGGAPVISLPAASAISSGYITALDYTNFNAKAPIPSAACGAGQVLTWNGTVFSCVADQVGNSGTLTDVTASSTTPIIITGTTVKNLAMSPASASASGYLSSADWTTFAAKAPTASPTFTGTVTAPTFSGALAGNAQTATLAATATTASAVAAGSIVPSSLTGAVGAAGQVPSRSAGDAWTWMTPLAVPGAACASGFVLTWTGGAASCVADANTTYSAGVGVTLTGTTFAANLTATGGNNGTATTVARGDHAHAVIKSVPIADLTLATGVTVGSVPVGNGGTMSGAIVPASGPYNAISGAIPMPVSAHPAIRFIVRNSTASAQTYNFIVQTTGIIAGYAVPNSRWGNTVNPVTIQAGATAIVPWAQAYAWVCNTACTSPTNTCPLAGVGDLFWFSFSANSTTGPAYDVVGVQLQF